MKFLITTIAFVVLGTCMAYGEEFKINSDPQIMAWASVYPRLAGGRMYSKQIDPNHIGKSIEFMCTDLVMAHNSCTNFRFAEITGPSGGIQVDPNVTVKFAKKIYGAENYKEVQNFGMSRKTHRYIKSILIALDENSSSTRALHAEVLALSISEEEYQAFRSKIFK